MSITECVKQRALDGDLVEICPLSGHPPHRPIYLTRDIAPLVEIDWDDESDEALATTDVRAALDGFIRGEEVTAAFSPAASPLFRRLAATRGSNRRWVWEIRIKPQSGLGQVRIFGCFSECDTFVGFSLHDRDTITSDQWPIKIGETTQAWLAMFPDYEPVESEDINDYITEPVIRFRNT